jgi:hypothetical protein
VVRAVIYSLRHDGGILFYGEADHLNSLIQKSAPVKERFLIVKF